MPYRQPMPRQWLMTDPRMGDALWDALNRLPRGGGIVFRHYGLPPAARRRLLHRILHHAKRRRQIVLVAGQPVGRADGRHNARRMIAAGRQKDMRSMAIHNIAEAVAARRSGADLVFLSPVFPTRSHPDTPSLGPVRAGLLLRAAALPAIAMGGMDASRGARMRGFGFHGWAAIDAWLE